MGSRLLVVIFLLIGTLSYGQIAFKDSILLHLKAKPEPFVTLNNRKTFLLSNKLTMYGIIGGLQFDQKVKLFAGIYGFGRANETFLQSTHFGLDSIYRTTSTSNFSLGIEYEYYRENRLSLSIPVQIGIGNISNKYFLYDKQTNVLKESYTMVPIDLGSNAYFEVLPWVGIRGGLGYRLNLGKKEAATLSSPYYNLGISVLLGKIYKEIKS